MDSLDRRIVACRKCPRLVSWREQVARERRAAFASERYWGAPVPNFGDPNAKRLIVGLAPAAHGANRTGRMFTGDRSGQFLYAALHRFGVAATDGWERANDGQRLNGVLITAVVHCAPPGNRPLREEIDNCRPYLDQLLRSRSWAAFLCLGSLAWTELFRTAGQRPPRFAHGAEASLLGAKAVASYHPSQQNTFTGKLTAEMFDRAVAAFLEA